MILHDQSVIVSFCGVMTFVKNDEGYMLHPNESVNEHIVEDGGCHYEDIATLGEERLPFLCAPIGVI